METIHQTLRLHLQGSEGQYTLTATLNGQHEGIKVPFVLDVDPRWIVQFKEGYYSAGLEDLTRIQGEKLYAALFPPPIEQIFLQAKTALPENRALRLQLVIEPNELKGIPWEALSYKGEPLASQPKTPLVRQLIIEEGQRQAVQVSGNLNVLFVGASPNTDPNYPLLNLTDTYQSLERRVRAITPKRRGLTERRVQMDALLGATRDTLASKLREKPYHIVCLVAHGEPGTIILETPDEVNNPDNLTRYPDPIPALAHMGSDTDPSNDTSSFEDILAISNSVRVLYLMSCRTATETQNALDNQSFAEALATGGQLPVVIAMQSPVSQGQSEDLLAAFLESLATYRPIDIALAEARQQMNSPYHRDVLSPVLYLQTNKSALFPAPIRWVNYALLLLALSFIVAVLVIFGVSIQSANQRRALEERNRIALLEEQNVRIQTLAQNNQRTSYPLVQIRQSADITLEPPMLSADTLWASDSASHAVYRVPLGATEENRLITTLEVAHRPTTPVEAYGSIWVSNRGASVVTRIDPLTNDLETYPVPSAPEVPIPAGGDIWVYSSATGDLNRIDVQSDVVTSTPLGYGVTTVFPLGDHIGYFQNNVLHRVRVTLDSQITDEVVLPEQPSVYAVSGNSLYMVIRTEYVQLDLATLQIQFTTTLPATANLLLVADSGIWLANTTRPEVWLIPHAQPNLITVPLDAPPRKLLQTDNRIWLLHANDRLTAIDPQQRTAAPSVAIDGLNAAESIIDDGVHGWLALSDQDEVLAIDLETGLEYRRFQLCERPLPPLFDGVQLWFACQNEIVALPAQMTQYTLSRTNENQWVHTPVPLGGLWWVIQESSSTLIAFDPLTQQEQTRLELPALNLSPLIVDAPYLWTYVNNGTTLLRLEPQAQPNGDWRVDVSTIEVSSSIMGLDIIGESVWVEQIPQQSVNTSSAGMDDVTRIDRHTLVAEPLDLTTFVATISNINGDYWVSGTGADEGLFGLLDPTSGRLQWQSDIPGTPFASWRPLWMPTQQRLWLAMGAPNSDYMLTIIPDMFGLASQNTDSFDDLVSFDPQTRTWGPGIKVPSLPMPPVPHGNVLWMATTDFIDMLGQQINPSGSQIVALDTISGQLYGPWPLCNSTPSLEVVGNWVIAGCFNEPHLLVIDANRYEVVYESKDIGTYPIKAIPLQDRILVVFRKSANAITLDANTGQLIRRYTLPPQPSEPIVFDEQVWMYYAQDGILERINPLLP